MRRPTGRRVQRPLRLADRLDDRCVGPELVEHLVGRKHHRKRSRDRQHAERHDEGRHADIGNEKAVDHAAGEPGKHPHREGDIPGIMPGEEQAGDDRDQAHHRPDREIDAAGDDDHGHPQRHDSDRREVARDVGGIFDGAEGRLIDGHDHDQHEQRDRHPEWLAREDALQRQLCSLMLDHIRNGGMTGFGTP